MKKIRVKYLAGITLGFLGITFLTTIIFLAFSNTRVLPWGISAIMVFFMLIGLSTLLGLTTNYDFKKKFGGEIIDENQFLRWSNILETRWIVTFIFQIIFIALNPILMKYIVGFDIEGIDKDLPPLLKFFLTFSPTLIFIFGGILWKINKSDEELIKLKRRERIRTSDLYELIQKVDFEEWIKADALLQRDKDLFCKMAEIRLAYIDLFDDSLKCNKEFILSLPAINYSILNWVSHANIEFDENDFSDELIIKIIEQSDEYFHLRGDSEFAKIYTKKIIELYTNWYKQNKGARPGSIMNVFYSLKNVLKIHNSEIHKFPTLEKYKVCLEDEHIVEKDMDKCPYCIV